MRYSNRDALGYTLREDVKQKGVRSNLYKMKMVNDHGNVNIAEKQSTRTTVTIGLGQLCSS